MSRSVRALSEKEASIIKEEYLYYNNKRNDSIKDEKMKRLIYKWFVKPLYDDLCLEPEANQFAVWIIGQNNLSRVQCCIFVADRKLIILDTSSVADRKYIIFDKKEIVDIKISDLDVLIMQKRKKLKSFDLHKCIIQCLIKDVGSKYHSAAPQIDDEEIEEKLIQKNSKLQKQIIELEQKQQEQIEEYQHLNRKLEKKIVKLEQKQQEENRKKDKKNHKLQQEIIKLGQKNKQQITKYKHLKRKNKDLVKRIEKMAKLQLESQQQPNIMISSTTGRHLIYLTEGWYQCDDDNIKNIAIQAIGVVIGFEKCDNKSVLNELNILDGYGAFALYSRKFCEAICKFILKTTDKETLGPLLKIINKYLIFRFPFNEMHQINAKTNNVLHDKGYNVVLRERFLSNNDRKEIFENIYKVAKWFENTNYL